jgi:hypothetical protein
MIVRTNRAMLELLGGDPEFFEPNFLPVPDVLVSQLTNGFKEVDGCVVPSSFESEQIWSDRRPRKDNHDDETGFECLLSKVYLEDFLSTDVPLSELCRVGLAYGFYLRTAISESQVFGQFRFIVDAQLPGADGSPATNACSVRFHRLRPNQNWLCDDLESYKENALLVMDWENLASWACSGRNPFGAWIRRVFD